MSARAAKRACWFLVALVAAIVTLPSGTAAAHPLGNFSVNHLTTIRFESERIVLDAIVDIAEVPTTQARPNVDLDGDGSVDAVERSDHAAQTCAAFASAATLTLDGDAVSVRVSDAAFRYESGQAGLETSRLGCELVADVPGLGATEQEVSFVDGYLLGRVGWREINAVGVDVGLVDSPVPAASVTDGLRRYPADLLSSPPDVREVTLRIGPHGSTTDSASVDATTPADTIATPPGPLVGLVNAVQARFDELIGGDLTVRVGLLAVALSVMLGASHALLPGHGKTVMAAYIAGRQGTARDAVIVGATVTATHTGGVLFLGLALTASTALAGEIVLGWLGAISGVLIAALGVALFASAIRRRRPGWLDHDHHHHHDHDHDGHDHGHGHHHHGVPKHAHGRSVSRRGLVGMGVAGGLVPSPSALIVLLSAIALGRTWFGVVLVLGYGLGMAGVLTLAGLVLVHARDRLRQRVGASTHGAVATVMRRWSAAVPFGTASMVVIVGTGLAARSLATL